MEREPIGQEPHLRWDRVVTLPLHATQQTEPKLGPGTGHDGTAIVLDEFATSNTDFSIGIGAKKAQSNVRNGRAKHRRGTFNMSTPPTVGLLMDREVVPHQRTLLGVEHGVRLAHYIPGNNETRHQKVWPSIIAGPMTIRGLQHGIKVGSLLGRLRCRLGLALHRGRGLTRCHVRTDHLRSEYLIAAIYFVWDDN